MLYWYLRMRNWLVEQEEGQDLIEYALLVVLIALVAVLALEPVGNAVKGVFNNIEGQLATP